MRWFSSSLWQIQFKDHCFNARANLISYYFTAAMLAKVNGGLINGQLSTYLGPPCFFSVSAGTKLLVDTAQLIDL